MTSAVLEAQAATVRSLAHRTPTLAEYRALRETAGAKLTVPPLSLNDLLRYYYIELQCLSLEITQEERSAGKGLEVLVVTAPLNVFDVVLREVDETATWATRTGGASASELRWSLRFKTHHTRCCLWVQDNRYVTGQQVVF
ncbi:hypothetical protein IWQ60_005802 [Tieghemiomyces parasiticus]|uniref:Uncharacterized protein n=1 Tax=Tieghemiomyces parasiticus TaxID=78921 RepID=A0A9W8DSR0_9FUNG|nr:hypothetical protein IWQ60_005802 [Tieghemiomyces parasiticus]